MNEIGQMDRKELGKLANNGIIVSSLQTSLSVGAKNVRTVPGLIMELVDSQGWQGFILNGDASKIYQWNAADFRRFIESDRPAGCQTPLHVLEQLLRGTDAWETYLELTRGEQGGNNNPRGLGGHTGKTAEVVNCDNITVDNEPTPNKPPPTGTSVSYSLRRLSRERPDLYERVKEGDLTANAAMIEAGFRDTQITVPLDPIKAGRRLAKHLTRAQFSALVDEALRIYTGR